MAGLVPRISPFGDRLGDVTEGGNDAPDSGVEGGVEGRGVFGKAADAVGPSVPGIGPRWEVGADVAGRDVFSGNIDGDPPDGCLTEDKPSDGPVLFCIGSGEGVVGLDCPGIRIIRPQRVQGPWLRSHSLPQRGQIMLHPSHVLVERRSASCCSTIQHNCLLCYITRLSGYKKYRWDVHKTE